MHYSCFIASGGSTWVATVRVSAGFQPNKMLLSMWEGRRSGVCLCAWTQRKRLGREVARRLRKKRKSRKTWEWKDTLLNQHCFAKGNAHRAGRVMHMCIRQTHSSAQIANVTHTCLRFCQSPHQLQSKHSADRRLSRPKTKYTNTTTTKTERQRLKNSQYKIDTQRHY